ncbi:MAG TPA: hypothetical protein VKR60_05110 [Candidatus Sulfotelmatobacter sp.]|nr:hypothetical protein [Candidatus Sulfotelmatobacter sp.]
MKCSNASTVYANRVEDSAIKGDSEEEGHRLRDQAVTSAAHYVDTQMAPADLVSIVSLGSSLLVNQDFTADHALLKKQLQQFSSGSGQGFEEGTTGTTEGTPRHRPAVYRR